MAIDFPNSPAVNDTFVASNGVTYQWTGVVWLPIGGTAALFVGDTPPATPGANQLWWNSTQGMLYIYYNDGNTTQWVPATPTLPVGVPAPLGWRLLNRVVVAASQVSIDFQNAPADINDLQFTFDVTPTVNDQTLMFQFYDNAGVIDNAAHYASTVTQSYHGIGNGTLGPTSWGSLATGIGNAIMLCTPAAGAAAGTATGIRGHGVVCNIKANRPHSVDFMSNYVDSGGTYQRAITGGGWRNTAGAITGLRLLFNNNIAAGSVLSVWGSP